MNVLSLFDGISCGQVALERAGIKVDKYFASEIEEQAIAVTMDNYPNTIQLGDVNNWKEWIDTLPKIDLILAGSPCQGFSCSGKRLDFDDPRSALFFKFADILNFIKENNNNEVNFLLENVKMRQYCIDIITKYVNVEPVIINSALVSAQNRIRYYWTNIKGVTQPEDKHIFVNDVVGGYVAAIRGRYINGTKKTAQFLESRYDGKTNTLTTVRKDNVVTKQTYPKHTLAIDAEYRSLTIEETEILQTLPVGYTKAAKKSKRYGLVGNSWTVDVIVHILKQMEVN